MANLYRRNGSSIWWVRFQLNGTRVQPSSHTAKKAQALRSLAKAIEEVRLRFTWAGSCAANPEPSPLSILVSHEWEWHFCDLGFRG